MRACVFDELMIYQHSAPAGNVLFLTLSSSLLFVFVFHAGGRCVGDG